jgi:alpha-amylase
MQCLLQFAYEQKNGTSVPSPIDGTGDTWWYQRGAKECSAWASEGVSDVLLPPVFRGASNGGGYDPYNHFDIGHLKPTRFGSRQDAQLFGASLKRYGLGMHADFVCAHMQGGKTDPVSGQAGYVFDYNGGRFPKGRDCYVGPHSPKDNVADPLNDFASLFGRQIAYKRGYFGDGTGLNGRGYMLRGMEQALKWLVDALDLQGARWDNTKSMDPDVISYWLRGQLKGLWGVGEYYDGNRDTLAWWIWQTSMKGMSGTFDYPLYFKLRDACNSSTSFRLSDLVNSGLCHSDPFHAVTFAENHDTDTGWSPVVWNKIFAYAFILTNPGLPCIYAKDYLEGDDTYGHGLRPYIRNLLWIRHKLMYGAQVWRDARAKSLFYETLGGPGMLVGLSTVPDKWQHITVQTNFGPNQKLHEYSGQAGDIWTDNYGRANVGLPPNVNGHGYVVYSRPGIDGKLEVKGKATTQIFEGHPKHTADIPAVPANGQLLVQRIWAESAQDVDMTFIAGSDSLKASAYAPLSDGWTEIRVVNPTDKPQAFKLKTVYKAAKYDS